MAQGIVGVGDGTAKLTNGASSKAAAALRLAPARQDRPARKTSAKGLGFERRFTPAQRRSARPGHLGAAHQRHHQPRRLRRLQDGRRRDPRGLVQLATDIVVSKYFRKAGLHGNKDQGETSVRQVVHRLAHTIREAGERFGGYFASAKDADTFEAELSLPARQPVRRVQLAGVVQLRPLPPVRDHRLRRQLRLAADARRTRRTRSSRRRTPTSARSARRASSSRSTTT